MRIKAKYSPGLPVFQAKICFVRSVFSLWTTFSYWGSDPATTLLSKGAGWLAGVTYPKLLDLFSSDTCCKWPWLLMLFEFKCDLDWIHGCVDANYFVRRLLIKYKLKRACLINGDMRLPGYLWDELLPGQHLMALNWTKILESQTDIS